MVKMDFCENGSFSKSEYIVDDNEFFNMDQMEYY